MNSKRVAKAGLALGLIGGGAAGFALVTPGVSGAQTSSTTPSTTVPADPSADHEARLRETLQPLLDNSTLTQAQVDAVVGALKAAAPLDGHRGGPGFGRDGADLSVAATTIGVTTDELRTALQAGQSIADVAKSKSVDPQAVIDAMVAAMNQRLTESVTAGKLTQAKADELAASATTRITDIVNGVAQPGRGFGHGHGPGGRPAPADGATTPPTTTN